MKFTVPVGKGPHFMESYNNSIYVANEDDHSVSVFNTDNMPKVSTIEVGEFPQEVHAYSDYVYVTNSGDGTVSIIDIKNKAVVDTVKVGKGPVSIDSHLGNVYVGNFGSDKVSVINTTTHDVKSITVGKQPRSVQSYPLVHPNLYVLNRESETVSVINLTTNTVNDTIAVGKNPLFLIGDPDGDAVYVANSESAFQL